FCSLIYIGEPASSSLVDLKSFLLRVLIQFTLFCINLSRSFLRCFPIYSRLRWNQKLTCVPLLHRHLLASCCITLFPNHTNFLASFIFRGHIPGSSWDLPPNWPLS